MDTKQSAKTDEVKQLGVATKTIVEDSESQNFRPEDTVDYNDNSGNKNNGGYGADVVETDNEPETYPVTKGLTKSEFRRMNSLDYAGNKNLAEGL